MTKQMMTNTYGTMPKNPFELVMIIEAMIEVESFKAVGENKEKTPMRQIKKNST